VAVPRVHGCTRVIVRIRVVTWAMEDCIQETMFSAIVENVFGEKFL
jgi:hypothetical protein